MSRIYAYEREPYRRQLDVEVLAIGDDEGGTFAVLDDTVLYPEGGGQPADSGHLGDTAVVDVRRAGDEIRHYLEDPVALGPATLTLDWRRRYDHMQQHTGQHLLTAVAVDRFGWKTTSFHLQPEVCDIELAAPAITAAQLEALEDAVAAEIRAARTVSTRRVSADEYAGLGARSRGLPAGHRGDVRLVDIEGIDLNTCGGTHLRSTAEIESLKLLGTEALRGGTRLRWLAGARVRQRLAAHEARNADLRAVLEAADDELTAIARVKLTQLKDAARRRRTLETRLAEAVTEGLLRSDRPVAAEHFDGVDMGFLRRVGQRFSGSEHPGVVLLTAEGDQGAFFVVAAGEGSALDVQGLGRQVAQIFGGRGGGSRRLFQGKADSCDRRAEALEVLADGS